MRVKCITQEGYLFSNRVVKEGDRTKTFHEFLTIGKEYEVYGIIMYEEGLKYLIYEESKLPEFPLWYPADLFEVTESKILNIWHYKFYGFQEDGVSAVWGYYDLVQSETHFNGLAEQEEKDISIFFLRKNESDLLSP